jgi:hypothetical protein
VKPRARFALGVGALVLATLPVRRDRVGPQEAKLFESVNGLPDSLERPAWAVMQAGALADLLQEPRRASMVHGHTP